MVLPHPIESNRLQQVENARQRRSRVAQRLNVPRKVRFTSSLAAALLNRHFEHAVPLIFPFDLRSQSSILWHAKRNVEG
jgi:hypothetical protein